MVVFVVADFEPVLKILETSFLVPSGAFSAKILRITPERLALRVQRRLHLVSRKFLHNNAALLR